MAEPLGLPDGVPDGVPVDEDEAVGPVGEPEVIGDDEPPAIGVGVPLVEGEPGGAPIGTGDIEPEALAVGEPLSVVPEVGLPEPLSEGDVSILVGVQVGPGAGPPGGVGEFSQVHGHGVSSAMRTPWGAST
ncbi:hypothetical protein [Streptacidiphilus sp. MAP12-20]|uniref:hypothetical protein n=1 Tax=Streptacidiphilus sp. MAP12-20 TaxID=3156299 RepID=UPI003517FA42